MNFEPKNKSDLIIWLLPKLKYKSKFFKIQKNPYYKYLKEEDIFHFFVVNILRENDYNVIVLGKEGKKTNYEKYKHHVLGNIAGRSDIFVTKCNTTKGCFFELKKSINVVFTQKLILKKSNHLHNQNDFLKAMESDGYVALFIYPENIVDNFKYLFDINL